jgi:hypothetical protein
MPRVLLAMLTCVVLAACGGGSPAAKGTPSPTPSPIDTLRARAELVDVGGGKHAYMECAGTGTPTVLLESGDESDNHQWDQVYPTLIDHTRVCRYDRLGTGGSDAASGCRELKDLRGVLEAALRAMGEPGPYLLVGTSGGGYLMAGFAYAHPAQVKGLVLAETPHAIVASQAPKELLAELRCDSPKNVERRDYVRVENEAWSQRHRLGDLPVTVISNDYGTTGQDAEERTNVAGQRGWLVLSPQAKQVVVRSGHNVPGNEPDVVVREVLRVLALARA